MSTLPQKQTFAAQKAMSVLGHKRTHAQNKAQQQRRLTLLCFAMITLIPLVAYQHKRRLVIKLPDA